MSATQSFTPSNTDLWTATWENPNLLEHGTENGFYYDGNINIGFGYNLTSNHNSGARAALATVGITFTNQYWKFLVELATIPSNESANTLNGFLGTKITTLQALQLLDNYDTTVVIPALKSHIVNFSLLPALTQTALEDAYYIGSSLLGPITYKAAMADNLVVIDEQLSFNAINVAKIVPSQSGSEERLLGDGLLAIGVVPTYGANNIITSLNESNAHTSDITQFLQDVLVGTSSLGSGGMSANQYVERWGSGPETSYQNLTLQLDTYLITQNEYVAATDTKFANIDSHNIEFSTSAFALINSGSYHGTVLNFLQGDTLDLAGITATSATLGANNVLTVHENRGSITLELAPTQNYAGETFLVTPDGHGGTDITIAQSAAPLIGINDGHVSEVNPATGAVTQLGSVTSLFYEGDGETSNNGLFYFEGSSGLTTVNISTGELVSSVPTTAGTFFADNLSGKLVGLTDGSVATVNPATGGVTPIGSITGENVELGAEGAYNGVFYFVDSANFLKAVNISTGQLVSSVSTQAENFVIDSSTGEFVGINGGHFSVVNPSTGAVTPVGSFTNSYIAVGAEAAQNGFFYFIDSTGHLDTVKESTGALVSSVSTTADNIVGTVGVSSAHVALLH